MDDIHAERIARDLLDLDAQDFADAIVEAYDDENLWLSLSDCGIENVKRHFSPEKAREVLRDILCLSV